MQLGIQLKLNIKSLPRRHKDFAVLLGVKGVLAAFSFGSFV